MTKTLLAGLATLALLSINFVSSANAENRYGMAPSREMMHHHGMRHSDVMMMHHHGMMMHHHGMMMMHHHRMMMRYRMHHQMM